MALTQFDWEARRHARRPADDTHLEISVSLPWEQPQRPTLRFWGLETSLGRCTNLGDAHLRDSQVEVVGACLPVAAVWHPPRDNLPRCCLRKESAGVRRRRMRRRHASMSAKPTMNSEAESTGKKFMSLWRG